jgi:UDP-3-O-[3-hydroxymyristoyl] glucosamine N-acyltransferase
VTLKKSYTLGELSSILELELRGNADTEIFGIGTLKNAIPGEISFLSNVSYVDQLADTSASAVILSQKFSKSCKVGQLLSSAPYVAFAKATALFAFAPSMKAGIAESATIDPSVILAAGVKVGENVVVESGVTLGANTIIGANSYIGHDCVIGADCVISPGVMLYHKVRLGDKVTIHSGSVIGADGFGFAFDGKKSIKVHQLGGVFIGSNVDIGAGTTIDRGALEDTIIGDGVKIDNQVQIGHNCIIGEHSIICGCVALAGSVTIGKYCIMGGASGAVGHITIADKTQVSAMSLVSKSITEPAMYSSGTGHMKTADWKRAIVRFQQLDSIAKRVKQLEQNNLDKS